MAGNDHSWQPYLEAVELLQQARTLYWKRMTPFLTFEGFLLAGFSLSQEQTIVDPTWLLFFIALLGLAIAVFWAGINRLSMYILRDRMETVKRLDGGTPGRYDVVNLSSDHNVTVLTGAWWELYPGTPLRFPANWIPILVALFWFATIALVVTGP
jgi:hypothetical protein